ncbi:MAG: ABC transporter permease, partial [Bacteroidales bacterium]
MNIFIRLIFRRLYKHPAVFFTKIFGFTIGFAILFFAVAYYLNEINYNKSFIEKHNIFQIFYSNQGVNSYRPFLPKQLSHEVEQIPEINAVTSINDQGVVVNLNNDYFFYRSLAVTDSDFFSVFNIDFIYGDKKQFKQKPNSLIITEEIASKHFGAANPIGKEIEVGRYENMKSYEITGVIENWPVKSTIQADMVMKKKALNAGNTTEMFFSSEKNITQVQLNKKINLVLSDRLDKTDKSYRQVSNSSVFEAVPIQNLYFLPSNYKIADNKGDKFLLSTILLLAIGIFIIVLVNNTILDIGFIITKLKEMGIRKINGAKSFHIFIIQIRENIVILSIAVILSVILLFILNVPVTGMLYPEWIADAKGNSLFNIDDTWLILLSFIGISLFTMIVVSIITLIFVNRSQSIALIQSKGNRKMTYPNYTGSLVILQVVISMILISGVIMVYKQLYYTANKDYGYHLTNVFYADVQLKTSSELREELMQHPDIEYVTFFFLPTREVIRPGKKIYQLSKPTKKYNIAKFYADYYYTETFGMQIIEGRSFKPEHHDKEEDRILVNETAARQMNLF